MENVRKRVKIELIRKDDNEKIIKQQSKVKFNGIYKLIQIVVGIQLNKMKF